MNYATFIDTNMALVSTPAARGLSFFNLIDEEWTKIEMGGSVEADVHMPPQTASRINSNFGQRRVDKVAIII